jgi:hypothetical protein
MRRFVKPLLLLALSAPYAWVVYAEGEALLAPASQTAPVVPAELGTTLEDAGKAAAQLHIRDELAQVILRAADECPSKPVTQAEKELGPATSKHAEVLGKIRLGAKALADMDGGRAPAPEVIESLPPALLKPLKERQDLLQDEKELRKMVGGFPNQNAAARKTTRDKLDEYREKQGHSEDLYQACLAKVEQVELTDAHHLNDHGKLVKGALANGAGEGAQLDAMKQLKKAGEALKAYTGTHSGEEFQKWAREQLGLLQQRLGLLTLVGAVKSLPLKEAFTRYEKLYTDPATIAEVKDAIKQLVTRRCEAHLPKDLTRDEKVVLFDFANKPFDGERQKVVVWFQEDVAKAKGKKSEYLHLSGYDETILDLTKVVKGLDYESEGKIQAIDVRLKATPRTEAACAYNEARKLVSKWTRAAVQRLRDACSPPGKDPAGMDPVAKAWQEEPLKDTWNLIQELNDAVNACPGLFD